MSHNVLHRFLCPWEDFSNNIQLLNQYLFKNIECGPISYCLLSFFSLVNVKEPLMVNEVPELLEKETPVRLVMPQNVYVKRLMIHK